MGEPEPPLVPEYARLPGQDLCRLADVAPAVLCEILRSAQSFVPLAEGDRRGRDDRLAGRTVVLMMNEPSTRTRSSFELAARRLGADVLTFSADRTSSATKGESMRDTVRNLDAMGVDTFVIRDRQENLPRQVTEWVRARVVNAGDGRGEHPTQGLLDALTVVESLGRSWAGATTLKGTHVVICGDVDHGRVAHSDLVIFGSLGARITLAGPPTLVSDAVAHRHGVSVSRSFDEALRDADVVIMLRIQRERLGSALPFDDETYHRAWGLSGERLRRHAPEAIVLHPGPLNRGVEIDDDVADGPRSRILRQVTLGVAVRMAVLTRACGVEVTP